jgi:hypothetical protein
MTALHRALILVPILVTIVFLRSATAGDVEPIPHLRLLDRHLTELLHSGMRSSPSFRALVERLDASDVVVYVRCSRRLRAGLNGQLTFVGSSAGLRYVMVALDPEAPLERRIATLGHELRHAVEIAETPSIVDSQSLGVAYARMGHSARTTLNVTFDTDAAVHAGNQIWRELMQSQTQRSE